MKKAKILGDLLRQIRNGKPLSLDLMAKKLDVDRNTLGAYEREERLPDFEFLGRFSRLTGYDVSKLIEARMQASMEAPAFTSALQSISDASRNAASFFARRSGVSKVDFHEVQTAAFMDKLSIDDIEQRFGARFPMPGDAILRVEQPHPGYVHLPLYDVHASAGNGTLNNLEQAVDVLAFKEDWVRRELRARPEDLNLIYVVGDSMEPDLRSGDIVLVDHTDTMAQREGVYVIRMDGALLVKQLQRLPGGVVKVISRNPAYETFPVDLKQLANPNGFAVVGRVVWACRRF